MNTDKPVVPNELLTALDDEVDRLLVGVDQDTAITAMVNPDFTKVDKYDLEPVLS